MKATRHIKSLIGYFASIYQVAAVMILAVGEYLEIGALQNSGGTLAAEASINRFQAYRLCGN